MSNSKAKTRKRVQAAPKAVISTSISTQDAEQPSITIQAVATETSVPAAPLPTLTAAQFGVDMAAAIGDVCEKHGKGWMDLRTIDATLTALMRSARSPGGWFKARFYGK